MLGVLCALLVNATLLLVHFSIMSKFYVLVLCVRVCVQLCCMNWFFVDNVVQLLFYVNMCACHAYFTINLLYLLSTHVEYSRVNNTVVSCSALCY